VAVGVQEKVVNIGIEEVVVGGGFLLEDGIWQSKSIFQ